MEPTTTEQSDRPDPTPAAVPGATTRDVPERRRTELLLDGDVVGWADYTDTDGARVFTHTEVHDPVGGRGLGTVLVRAALDAAAEEGLRVVPVCPFVHKVVDRHPEYAPLVDRELLARWGRRS